MHSFKKIILGLLFLFALCLGGPSVGANGQKRQTFLMISTAQSPEELRRILKDTEDYPNRHWVLRGLPEHLTLKTWLASLKPLLTEPGLAQLSIEIDPVRFAHYGITRVPAIVEEDDTGTPLSSRGTTLEWPTRINSDPDQRTLLKERVKALAQNHSDPVATQNQGNPSLPETQRDRIVHIDPTVIAPRTLKTRDGAVIAIEGTPVNPFLIVPLKETLLLFDAREEAHIEWAMHHPHLGQSLLIASLRDGKPTPQIEALSTRLNQRVFMLNTALESHLQLESLPASVMVEKGVLNIHYEIPRVLR